MSEMEIICTRCDGLGHERMATKDMHPATNVAGWHRGPVNSTGWQCDYYWRSCEVCDGTGFRPSGTSVPATSGPPGLDMPDMG